MELNKEYREAYSSKTQREVLLQLISNSDIEKNFFLTGGTALSVFYLAHRKSEDLDLFTCENIRLSDIDFQLKTDLLNSYRKIKESKNFLSILIKNIKVDFVFDRLSNKEKRYKYKFENGHFLLVDNLNNIISNKFTTLVSRTEIKDYIDCFLIFRNFPAYKLSEVYKMAKAKDAIFDDPPTVAYQIECGLDFVKQNSQLFPNMITGFSKADFYNFYSKLVKEIYDYIKN